MELPIRHIETFMVKRTSSGRIYNRDAAILRTAKQGDALKIAQDFYGSLGWTVESITERA